MIAMVKEKRLYRTRVIVFIVLHGLIGLHLVAWYLLDYKAIGAIDMQELFRNFIEKNILTAGGLFFLLFIGLSLIWGRFFCGWLCHIGLTYDVLDGIQKRLGIPTTNFPLRLGPVAATGILIWYFLSEAVANRLKNNPTSLQVEWGLTEPWELLPGWINGTITLAVVLLIMPFFLGRRPFCRLLCPWGYLFGWANRVSPLKIRKTGNCTMCGACSKACPMDIDVSKDINTLFHVSSINCTNCMQCTASCPTDALSFSLPHKENRVPPSTAFLPGLLYPKLRYELLFWLMVAVVGLIYSELYGIGIFLAFCCGVLLALFTWRFVRAGRGLSKRLTAMLVLVLAWSVVAKDGVAGHHHRQGLKAFHANNFEKAQYHYEWSDRLLWVSSKYELYHLYIIYKQTGQEDKRLELYERYEEMRGKRK